MGVYPKELAPPTPCPPAQAELDMRSNVEATQAGLLDEGAFDFMEEERIAGRPKRRR